MSTVVVVLLFLLGLILIIKGGDWFVDAAVWIAEVSGIPKFIVGATVVSLATTIPELLVSLMAAAQGSVGMAVGNAVGSVTANIGLIMGISIVCMPAAVKRGSIAFKGILMILSCALLCAFSFGGSLSIAASCLILLMFIVYIVNNVVDAKKQLGSEKSEDVARDKATVVRMVLSFIGGAAGVALGAQLLVDNGTKIAQLLGIPEAIIGVTIVAIGTSLPELVTTITAISRKQSSLSIGNIIGANVIDLTLIMPVCALVSGKALPVEHQSAVFDIPVCLGFTVLAILPPLLLKKFPRAQGVAMLVCYAVYVVVLCTVFTGA